LLGHSNAHAHMQIRASLACGVQWWHVEVCISARTYGSKWQRMRAHTYIAWWHCVHERSPHNHYFPRIEFSNSYNIHSWVMRSCVPSNKTVKHVLLLSIWSSIQASSICVNPTLGTCHQSIHQARSAYLTSCALRGTPFPGHVPSSLTPFESQ